ncbi:MAG: DUF4238 domain-containing protein [Candidatus Nealsonbacteria bacterium]|nr:DUF4238 domain-containing protein [Candidatus Nealsonbacteria bacterium]
MTEEIKRRNHFIPKVHLEKFLNDDSTLYVYKKGKQFFKKGFTKEDRLITVVGSDGLNNIAVKNNLYIPKGNLPNRNIFEDFFNDEIESYYNNLINDINHIPFSEVIKKHRSYIINLTASMMGRTLHSKDEIEEMYTADFQMFQKFRVREEERIESLKKEFAKREPNLSEQEILKIINNYLKQAKEGKLKIKIGGNTLIKRMFEKMGMMAQLISDMNIHILKNETEFLFITSDNPAVYFVPPEKVNFLFREKSLGGPYTELYFPLSKEICILMTRREKRDLDYVKISQGFLARTVNYNIAHNSKSFIFSPDRNKFLDKFIEESIPYPFEMKVG